MQDNYFTTNEWHEVKTCVRRLLALLCDQVSDGDVSVVRRLVEQGISQGVCKRDWHGFNPTVRHLRTALLLCQSVAPDRSMTLATLLYGLCSDDFLTEQRVGELFGDDVSALVKGLLNVAQLYKKHAAVQDENFHKLLLTFAQDIRVIIIMIADRVALMRVINQHPDQKFVEEISTESRYLYAPLAHRLGLYALKTELEDLSLKYLNRKVYSQIALKLSDTKQARERYINDFIKPIDEALKQSGLTYEIKGRTKSINSIWNKMRKKGVDLNGMYDLFAIRIILDTAPDAEKKACWLAYSIVTDIYTANPSRLKDWISIPKSNGYESLHITVRGPGEKWVEVQIRTRRMDAVAERGLAAHWKYKGVKSDGGDMDVWMNNVREVLEAGSHDGRMSDLIKDMRTNPYDNEVFVFTPKGDLFRLPQGATLLDFAFHIHTRVGCTCMGGKVDGKNQKLNYRLKSGDTVEILTSSAQSPRPDWLNYVVTNRARNKIKQAVNEGRVHQAALGRETLQRRFKNRKIEVDEATMAKLVKRLGYKTSTDFLVAVHDGSLDVNDVVEQYVQLVAKADEPIVHGTAQDFVLQHNASEATTDSDILVVGADVKGVNYKLSRCCNPIYGDRIAGFIASDGAIKIHRADCGNLKHLQGKYPYRIIRARWTGKVGTQFATTLKVLGKDDLGIVTSITSVINKSGDTQLRGISIQSQGGLFEGYLTISVPSLDMLDGLIKKILNVKGVKQVERI